VWWPVTEAQLCGNGGLIGGVLVENEDTRPGLVWQLARLEILWLRYSSDLERTRMQQQRRPWRPAVRQRGCRGSVRVAAAF
jgi:hypothetical protein